MLWAFSIFHPEDCPVLSGILEIIGLQANKPAKNIYRAKHVDQEISSGSDDADDAMESVQGTLTSHCGA
jgi:hypothetical protein